MNVIEKRIDELNRYQPDRTAPSDLIEFWQRTKDEAINTILSRYSRYSIASLPRKRSWKFTHSPDIK